MEDAAAAIGALNDYLAKEVVVTVRSPDDGAPDGVRVSLHGRLEKGSKPNIYVVRGADGQSNGSLRLPLDAVQAAHWHRGIDRGLRDDFFSFKAAGVKITIGPPSQ